MRKPNKVLIGLIFILVMTGLALAQANFTTESITIRDGLSSNNVRDVIQDKYGYMWFATSDGLNKYDGYKITVFKAVPGDSTSLPSNSLYRFLEDKQGVLWISTSDGLAKYNRDRNTFSTYRVSTTIGDAVNGMIGLFEDSQGNLWVSTANGNLQFDREKEAFLRFDVMKIDNSIADFANAADATIEGSDGGLYTGSEAFGLLKFDYDASLFVQLPLKDNFQKKLEVARYFEITADKDNNLWLSTQKGLFKIDLDNNTSHDLTPFKKKVVTNPFWDNSITGLHIDKNQNIWIGTGRKGLYLFDSKKQSIEKLKTPPSEHNYTGFYTDDSGILWYGTTRGVRKYDFNRKPIETFKLTDEAEEAANKGVLSFYGSRIYQGWVWLGTQKGLYLFNKKNNTTIAAPKINQNLSRFIETPVNSIIESNDGILWIATNGEGLYSYNLNSGKFKNYKHKAYNTATIKHNQIHALFLDKYNTLWVGTHEGLNVFKKDNDALVTIPSFLNRNYDPELLVKINKLRTANKPVTSIINVGDYADLSKEFVLRKDSKILIYSLGEGLPQWNMVDFGWLESSAGDTVWNGGDFNETFFASGDQKNRITIGLLDLKGGRYKLRYKSDDSHSVQSYNAVPPQDSSYWGAQIFLLNDDEYTRYKEILENSINKPFLKGNDIQSIYEDSNNNMWVGTTEGVSKIDTNLTITNYIADETANNALSNKIVEDIIEDRNGNIWLATQNGLSKFDPLKNSFTRFSEKDGLPTSILKAIEMDDDGNLWVSSIKGISKIELNEKGEEQIIVNYDVKDGLQGYEFTDNASFKDESGKLYFAGLDGFNVFYPGSSNRTAPHLSLQNITVSNKSIHDLDESYSQDLEQLSEISLAHTQNDISFEFASLHFSRPDKNRLMYKMDGVDEEWQVGDRRFASYTNLDPGDYVFNLRGSNGDGVWSDEIKRINIHVAAPWYNNWIAYIIYAALFLGILYTVRRIEIGRQKKNAKILESQLRAEAAESKAKAAEAQAQVVEAENQRKSRELEEARQLQLSMLPKELPQLPHLDIAVYMQTATEVGGDYYDFHVGLDGTLTVVIGDATGHGMKAGTMVTAAKSLFNSYAPNPDILFSFREITRCIRQLNMGKMSMCLSMLKIQGDKLHMSSAGMPPSFIFRRDTRVVEEHLFKAMPLGTMEKFPYQIKDTTLQPGDTILLLSDGLPELENDRGEIYGYQRIRNGFENVAEKSPEEIVSYLKNEGAGWVNGADPDDDVTFVVIKVK
ncbi:MAG: hypothetical protein Kow0042_15860 [Calditrichia bacterium]